VSAPLNVVAFASGGGTNFQALLDHGATAEDWQVAGLITNKSDAGALDRAGAAGVDTVVIPTKDRDPLEVSGDTLSALDSWNADVICLAGYMRLLPTEVVRRFRGRILNIHPALLPSFGGKGMYGMNVHRAVVEAGESWSGATVHFVDERYDEGAIVGQLRVPVQPDDTPESLQARVLDVEHLLYPTVVDHVCAALRRGQEAGPLPADPTHTHIRLEELS
jgi:phosphoribosylglycinamide formyltransferase 1